MRTRSRKGFTLIELIIVIVVLGILAGIAIAGYTSVIRRSNISSVEQSALSFNRNVMTLAAQKASTTGSAGDQTSRDGAIILEALQAGDGPRGVTVHAMNGAATPAPITIWDGSASTITATGGATGINTAPTFLQFVKNGASVCLRLTSDNTQALDTANPATPTGSITTPSSANGWIILRRVANGAGTTAGAAAVNGCDTINPTTLAVDATVTAW